MRKEDKHSSMTPVMRQYRSVKERYPDAILLFRMGDFYEMFYEDAVIASKIMGIVLTSRDKGRENPVPMAGVPYHSVTSYLKKLIDAGYRAAICEQLEEPSKAKTIVARDVVRLITPGANIDTDLLDAKESNFLLAALPENPGSLEAPFAVAMADISTGQMMAAQVEDISTLASELVRFQPREVLLPPGNEPFAAFVREKVPQAVMTPCRHLRELRGFESAIEIIDELTGRDRASGESWSGVLPALPAAASAALLEYLRRTQPGQPLPIKRIALYKPSQFMILDEMTVRHLELVTSSSGDKKGALLALIDKTVTSMGSRLLRSWLLSPLTDIHAIRRRQDVIQFFLDDHKAGREIRKLLAEICDIERILSRCIVRAAAPRELGALRDALLLMPRLAEYFASARFMENVGSADTVLGAFPQVPSKLSDRLQGALVTEPPPHAREGGIFARGFNGELDQLAFLSSSSKEAIAALEKKEKEATGIHSLKIKYNKVFGYFIEVTKSNLPGVPRDRYITKQTIAGGERYYTGELKDLEAKILTADEKRKALESELFASLVRDVAGFENELRALAEYIATVDVTSALAGLAAASGYTRPLIDDSSEIRITDGRHPVVEAIGAAEGFIPNDVELDIDGERLWIITGPNMSGKSTFMRQVALNVILAQMGSYIPASEARIGICDRIFTRVGASDNLAWGQSTFMVEMTETAAILLHATPRSLVVLDEIGRGTSTFDGMSIAWAVAEYLHDKVGCRTLLATHYHELTELTSRLSHAENYNVSATEFEDKIIFLRKVRKGGSSRSYGIQVASLAGVPAEVIGRAREILARVESENDGQPGLPGRQAGGGRGGGGGDEGSGQLSLFAADPAQKKNIQVRRLLAEVDVDKMTPLEAMNLLARLKSLTEDSD
ncbi:MAG: DNA mismatch repair protein MutS [Pseudomonadota bacterium]